MKFILVILLMAFNAFAVELRWAPPVTGADGYLLFRSSGDCYKEVTYCPAGTNYFYADTNLVDGVNYFSMTSLKFTNSLMVMSTTSNIAIVTNTPSLVVETVVYSSTNLFVWGAISTNQIDVGKQPAEFFRSSISMNKKHTITVPPMP